nr:unnamed protein product [Callosobruchus analis]
MRFHKSGCYHTSVPQHLKASFEIAFMIAKQKEPHTIIFGEDAEQKMKSVSLSNNTVKRLHEWKEEVITLLEFKEKHDFLAIFKDYIFQWNLAYLTDIFSTLNELNFKAETAL